MKMLCSREVAPLPDKLMEPSETPDPACPLLSRSQEYCLSPDPSDFPSSRGDSAGSRGENQALGQGSPRKPRSPDTLSRG